MYKSITVIGTGSLGSFFCKSLIKNVNINQLILIDFDVVNKRNLETSYFFDKDIDKFKVDSLKENLKFIDNSINIIPEVKRFSKTLNINSDLVVDCRDFLTPKRNLIDVKLSLAGKFLIIDCRKNEYINSIYEGYYIHRVSKEKLEKSCDFVTSIINSRQLDYFIQNNKIKEIDVDQVYKNYNLMSAISDIDFDYVSVVKETKDDNFSEITNKIFGSVPDQPVKIQFIHGSIHKTKTINLSKVNEVELKESLQKIVPSFLDCQVLVSIRKNLVTIVPVNGAA